ncbi:prephenate dehydrogenase/arogenate dehydrogenase family protein [candidate division GN15 bacterium]|nr:prephenate dehydrogenase/arogenate dehydrogenase family protein [candidate division GN15 bacterium]
MSTSNPLHGLTVGVVGLGQIGGSIAAALTSRPEPPTLIGFDIDPDISAAATERGIVHDVAESVAMLLDRSDIVVLAVHQSVTIGMLKEHAERIRGKSLVTDTCSLKSEILEAAKGENLTNFVGGHPIAGSEKKGADSWDTDLFQGAVYAFVEGDATPELSVALLKALIGLIGANAVAVEPAEHDRLFALTIGLPHVLAYTLAGMLRHESDRETIAPLITGPSWRGATRVAASDAGFVEQMLWSNRGHLAERIDLLIEALAGFRGSLREEEPSTLRSRLEEGSISRDYSQETDQ